MSISKEDALNRAMKALEKAQQRYDEALMQWQDELDTILLKPVHARVISRKQAIALARAIENEECFEQIMELGMLPTGLNKRNTEDKRALGSGHENNNSNEGKGE